MARIIIASHGPLAQALVESASMIVGAAADVVSVLTLDSDDNLEAMRERLQAELDSAGEALVLVDLFGGTPANAAAWASQGRRVKIVSGVNLPMLLDVLAEGEDTTVQELARVAETGGNRGIVNVGDALRGS